MYQAATHSRILREMKTQLLFVFMLRAEGWRESIQVNLQ